MLKRICFVIVIAVFSVVAAQTSQPPSPTPTQEPNYSKNNCVACHAQITDPVASEVRTLLLNHTPA